jgi:hypothetical protein
LKATSPEDQIFLKGIRTLDALHADYLQELGRGLLETASIENFLSFVDGNGIKTLVFVNQKGKSLRNDIRREVVRLHEEIYGYV